jgi:ribosome-binding factor A
MKQRKRARSRGDAPFIDPEFAEALSGRKSGRSPRQAKVDHKSQMVSRQAYRALVLAMSDESDDVLRECQVESVAPAPDASRLLVRLVMPRDVALTEILQRLEQAQGRLRRAVAEAITRKRTPELMFVPVGIAGGGGGGVA